MFERFSNKTAEKYPDFIKATGYGTTATAFTFEEKRKKGQKEYREKVWVREQP